MRISDWSSDVCSSYLIIGLPCCRQPTDFAQFLLTAWRVRGNVCQRFILDDSSAGEVLVLCFPFAPCGKGFQAAKHIGLATGDADAMPAFRSEEHTSELQSLMRISYAVFCLKKKNKK